MWRGFVMCLEPLPLAVGQEKLPPEQRAIRTALPLEARWSCRQGHGERPAIGNRAKMNLTNYDSN
jgi:hypothetical protein